MTVKLCGTEILLRVIWCIREYFMGKLKVLTFCRKKDMFKDVRANKHLRFDNHVAVLFSVIELYVTKVSRLRNKEVFYGFLVHY